MARSLLAFLMAIFSFAHHPAWGQIPPLGICERLTTSPFDAKTDEAKRELVDEINKRLTSSGCIDNSKHRQQMQPQIDLFNIETLIYGGWGNWKKVLEIRKQERDLYPRLAGIATMEIVFADLAQTPPQIKEAYAELDSAKEGAKRNGLVPGNALVLLDRYRTVYGERGEKPLQLFFGALKKGVPPIGKLAEASDSKGPIALTKFEVVDPKPLSELLKSCPKSAFCEDALTAAGDCTRLARDYPEDFSTQERCELSRIWDKGAAALEDFAQRFPRSRYAPIALSQEANSLRIPESTKLRDRVKKDYPDFKQPQEEDD